jgi:hypothetical protein
MSLGITLGLGACRRVGGVPLQTITPGEDWTGTAASGFAATPTDPTRTTAKPALRPLVPPNQRFTDRLLYGVAAAANDGGTLIGGIDRVRFHFEGRTVDVLEPALKSFLNANGNTVTYWGYWCELVKPSGTSGEAHLYVEAIPADATMQSRVIGPISFFPNDTLHDAEYTIDPDVAASATNFHDFDDFVVQLKLDAPANPRVTFKKAMSNVEMNFAGAAFAVDSYVTVEADFPVTFGRTSLGTSATVDTDSVLRPRAGRLWLKGSNITIDYAYAETVYAENDEEWVLDGITLTNSRGANALWRGGPYVSGYRVRGNPWFLECTASNLENVAVEASLVRSGTYGPCSRDIFAEARCVVGTTVTRHNDTPFNDDTPAFTVQYSGSEATATVARSGSVNPNDCTYTFKWGANSATFDVGNRSTYYAGTAGDGYTFADVVDYINGAGDYAGAGLADSDAGWSATLNDTEDRQASSGSLAGLKAQGFGDTDCKTGAVQVVSSFDAHGDWWQQRFTSVGENVIVYDNTAYDMQTQNIFISSNVDASDFLFFNNALGNDPVGSDYFSEDTVFSQLGRQNNATALSHVVVAHCSLPNQQLQFRNDGTASTFDAYCLVANNALVNVDEAGSATISATIADNHVHAGETPLSEATGTTSGGDGDSLFADFNAGDFTPAGDLLTNLKAPVVARDIDGNTRAASDAAGAVRVTS